MRFFSIVTIATTACVVNAFNHNEATRRFFDHFHVDKGESYSINASHKDHQELHSSVFVMHSHLQAARINFDEGYQEGILMNLRATSPELHSKLSLHLNLAAQNSDTESKPTAIIEMETRNQATLLSLLDDYHKNTFKELQSTLKDIMEFKDDFQTFKEIILVMVDYIRSLEKESEKEPLYEGIRSNIENLMHRTQDQSSTSLSSSQKVATFKDNVNKMNEEIKHDVENSIVGIAAEKKMIQEEDQRINDLTTQQTDLNRKLALIDAPTCYAGLVCIIGAIGGFLLGGGPVLVASMVGGLVISAAVATTESVIITGQIKDIVRQIEDAKTQKKDDQKNLNKLQALQTTAYQWDHSIKHISEKLEVTTQSWGVMNKDFEVLEQYLNDMISNKETHNIPKEVLDKIANDMVTASNTWDNLYDYAFRTFHNLVTLRVDVGTGSFEELMDEYTKK
eukprot:Pgem_evm1s12489